MSQLQFDGDSCDRLLLGIYEAVAGDLRRHVSAMAVAVRLPDFPADLAVHVGAQLVDSGLLRWKGAGQFMLTPVGAIRAQHLGS